MQANYDMLKDVGLTRWMRAVVDQLGSSSGLLTIAKDSPVRDGLLVMPVALTAASTLHRHLDLFCWEGWGYWASYSETPNLSIPVERGGAMLSELVLSYASHDRRSKNAPVSCSGLLSALAFVASKADCTSLMAAL